MKGFYTASLLKVLFIYGFGCLATALQAASARSGNSLPDSVQEVVPPLMGKLTLMVDMSNHPVAGTVYIAANFFSFIGLNDWTPYPMCDLGNNIWAICITNVPAGRWQYKFLNGPGGWEFQSSGGPCTNPADNNNRWLNVSGGTQTEGPFCFESCSVFCNGPVPILSDVEPPLITEPIPVDIILECGSALPDATALTASDNCDVNATITTGMPVQTQNNTTCGGRVVTRTWTATDCWNNKTTGRQIITIRDQTPPVINASIPANITVQCGSAPAPLPLPASDACDITVTATAIPTDVVTGPGGPCGIRTVRRTWQARDCTGNTATRQQVITILDGVPPVITAIVPAAITVSCEGIPAPAPLPASDACDPAVTATTAPTDNRTGLNACGVGTLVRTWRVSDCAGNSTVRTQTIVVEDKAPPVITPPAPLTASCAALPVATPASAQVSDNCSGTLDLTYEGEQAVGSGCPYQLVRTWRAVDCSGNTATATQIIAVIDTTGPVFTKVPKDTIVCAGFLPAMDTLRWSDCGSNGRKPGKDTLIGHVVIRTWQHTDACGNTGTAVQKIRIYPLPPVQAGTDQTLTCTALTVPVGNSAPPASGYTYLWSGPGISGPQTNQPAASVNAIGQYIVIMTDTTGGRNCVARDTVNVTQNTDPPIAALAAPSGLNCQTTQILLNGSASTPVADIGYQWIGPGNALLGTAATQNASQGGIYTLLVRNNSNGCTATATATVSQNTTPPVANAGSDQNLTCAVTSVSIGTAQVGSLTYSWLRDGIPAGNSAILTVGMPGLYTLQVTDPATGCSANDTVLVQVPGGLPVANAGANRLLTCGTTNVLLDGSGSTGGADILYQWTGPGNLLLGTTNTQNASQPGIYMLRVTNNATGCSATATVEVTANTTAPVANAGTNKTLTCRDATASLGTAPVAGNYSYDWSANAGNTAVVNVSMSGTYTVTVTNTDNQCTATDTAVVGSDTMAPVANAGPDRILTCQTATAILDGSGSATGPDISYQWSNPLGLPLGTAITQNIAQPGVYRLVVTNSANGCTASAVATVTANSLPPTADAGPDQVVTCRNPSVEVGTSGTSGLTYMWSGAAGNKARATVTTAGTYTLTVTDPATGCTATDLVMVGEDKTPPVAQAGPGRVIDCTNVTVTLDGAGSAVGNNITYQWSGPGGAALGTALTQNVNQTGLYTLLVSNSTNGCTATDTVSVRSNTALPVANAGADSTLTCARASVTIGAAPIAGLVYAWSNNVGSTASLRVNMAGTYTLSVTDPATGCTATDEVIVRADLAPPAVDAGADATLTCTTTSVALGTAGGSGISYTWSNNGSTAGTAATLTATAPGIYVLTAINTANGCSQRDTAVVVRNGDFPLAEAVVTQPLTCSLKSVLLDGSPSEQGSHIRYQWIGPGNTPLGNGLTQNAVQTGNYRLVVTNSTTGCSATATVSVFADTVGPLARAGTDKTLTCAVISAEIGTATATPDRTYNWSNNAGNSPVVSVSTVGTYTLTVTNTLNGCTGTDVVEVLANTTPPIADAGSSQTLSCLKKNVLLDGSGSAAGVAIDYQWLSANNLPLGTTATQSVTQAGIYQLIVTNTLNGCSSVAAVQVAADTLPPVVNAGADQTLTCALTSAAVGTTGTGDLTYVWTNGGISIGSSSTLTVQAPGIYILTATSISNGCSAADTVAVTRTGDFPAASAGDDQLLNCRTTAVTLNSGGSSTGADINYQWIGPGNALLGTALTQSVNQGGTYTLIVANALTGCSSTATVRVNSDTIAPMVSAGADGIMTCVRTSLILGGSPGTGLAYTWSQAGTTVGNTSFLTVTEPGTYVLTALNNANGCTASDTTVVSTDRVVPAVVLSGETLLTCSVKQLILDGAGSATGNNIRYQWQASGNTPLGTGLTQSVTAPGLYTLFVINTANGCTATDTLTVRTDTRPPVANAGPYQDLTCSTLSVNIGTGAIPGNTYIWSNGNTAAIAPVNMGGVYTLTVTNTANGCTATDAVTVTQRAILPLIKATALGQLTCAVNSIELSGAGSAVGQGIAYRWLNAANVVLGTGITQTVQTPGTYRLEVFNNNTGCSATTTAIATADTLPPQITLPGVIELGCNGTPAVLAVLATPTSGSGVSYQWSGPSGFNSTAARPAVRTAGNYRLTVTQAANGCTATSITAVQLLAGIKAVEVTIQQTGCSLPAFGQLRVDSIKGGIGPYLLELNQGGFTSKRIYDQLAPNAYKLRVQDANGCDWDTSFTILPPDVFSIRLPEALVLNLGDSLQLNPIFSTNPVQIRWSGSTDLNCDTCAQPWAKPLITSPYTVTATNPAGCTASATVQIVVRNLQSIYVPNIFSPNSNHGNDRITIFAGNNVEEVRTFRIFNRWGELVFAKENFLPNDERNGWDGLFNGKDAAVGVYVYYTEIRFKNGETLALSGDILLDR